MTQLDFSNRSSYFKDPYWENVTSLVMNKLEDAKFKDREFTVFSESLNPYGYNDLGVEYDSSEDALYFGTDGSVNLGTPLADAIQFDEEGTLDFWFKANRESGNFEITGVDLALSIKINFEVSITIQPLLNTSDPRQHRVFLISTNGVPVIPNVDLFPFSWCHIAVTRNYYYDSDLSDDRNLYSVFLNGTLIDELDVNAHLVTLDIVGSHGGGDYCDAFIKNYRVTRGIRRFTNNFVPHKLLTIKNQDALYYQNNLVSKVYLGDNLVYPQPLLNSDPFKDQVVIYLKGDGVQDSTDIIDSSPSPKVVTTVGTVVISEAVKKYGNSSILFDGSSRLEINGSFLFSDSWTVELWAFTLNDIAGYVSGGTSLDNRFYITQGTSTFTRGTIGLPNYERVLSTPNVTSQWRHLALVKNHLSLSFFVDGVIVGTGKIPANLTTLPTIYIGEKAYTGAFAENLYGYIDSLRITEGVVRYFSSFNPETDTYLAY